jgi:hypothetical protein
MTLRTYAHTNLGTALDELMISPPLFLNFVDTGASDSREKDSDHTLFFSHLPDCVGDYEEALKVYQQFLSRATEGNQSIDKVKLRLPVIQKQIREGKGRKKR